MIQRLADNTAVLMGQKKSDSTIKTGYISKSGQWILSYQGDFPGLKSWLKHQQQLSEKRLLRQTISDICGTSYRSAMADMGLSA